MVNTHQFIGYLVQSQCDCGKIWHMAYFPTITCSTVRMALDEQGEEASGAQVFFYHLLEHSKGIVTLDFIEITFDSSVSIWNLEHS